MTTHRLDPQPRDAELVARARQGDQGAYGLLVERHFGAAFAVALAALRNHESAEDLAQEVFLRAWLHLGRLRDADSFAAWTVRMARNLAASRLRSGERRSRIARMVPMDETVAETVRDGSPDAALLAAGSEESQALAAALAKLPARDRELVLLHFQQERSQREIAARLGEHHTTVGRRLAKALDSLRGLLGEAFDARRAAAHRPAAASRAMALVAAAATMEPAARAALAKAAEQSLPGFVLEGHVAPAWLAWLPKSLHPLAGDLAAGVLAMGAGNKVVAAVAVAALLGGGGYLMSDSTGGAPAEPAGASAQAGTPARVPSREIAYAVGTEISDLYRFGETARMTFSNAPEQIRGEYPEEVLITALPGQGLEILSRQGGEVNTEMFVPGTLGPDGLPPGCLMQVWPDGNLFHVRVVAIKEVPDGYRMTIWSAQRPDLIPETTELALKFQRGEVSFDQLKRDAWKLFDDRGLVPCNPELAESFRAMHAAWRR
ncbi:MAG: RNA polymerase sigma factor [Candidatus Sumerlaeia bacterium]|nr:RNA polymerase sigma factor [Candidatus Sumerlaeia bacterium]